ncbi:MAG TPA: carbohydrate kinase [Bacteroidales bacterium]|nr:carbohydrate kinase [Bacteroidales bacterium]
MEKVLAVFDIGKTNKKLLLFNEQLQVVQQTEEKFPVTSDEDGTECDDIVRIEAWMHKALEQVVADGYRLCGVNFSTYGASLVWVDGEGQRLSPVYNYLKEVESDYQAHLFEHYGGETEFCRRTASPALGVMLNSGIQLLWVQKQRPAIARRAQHILHFPQYLSSVFTQKYVSEYTSLGCHTFMWDFDKMHYHSWLSDAGFSLPAPVPNDTVFPVEIGGQEVQVGVGIHDSSASLVPYLRGSSAPFLLMSTGTWLINMNPFNHSPLSEQELRSDSLCYMSIKQQPVKSSRFFMGHIHDVNVKRLTQYFNLPDKAYKEVGFNAGLLDALVAQRAGYPAFFAEGVPEGHLDLRADLSAFPDFETAYHQLMYDLTRLAVDSVHLVLGDKGLVKDLFVSGGFARNRHFVYLVAALLPHLRVRTSEVDNASALGAALVLAPKVFPGAAVQINLGLDQ